MNAVYSKGPLYSCLLEDNDLTQSSSPTTPPHLFQPQAEDILTDEDLLDLFRIVKQVLRKKPDANKLAKLLFCVSYALGDHVKFFKPLHEDRILFRNDDAFSTSSSVHVVRLPQNSSCCSSNIRPMDSPPSSSSPSTANGVAGDTLSHPPLPDYTNNSNHDSIQKWHDMTVPISSPSSSTTSQSPLTKLLPVPFLTNPSQPSITATTTTSSPPSFTPQPTTPLPSQPFDQQPTTTSIPSDHTSTDAYSVRSYTNLYPSISAATPLPPPSSSSSSAIPYELTEPRRAFHRSPLPLPPLATATAHAEILTEPKQRGFYYQEGRIAREPVALQRYAEQGILTQASLMQKRKRATATSSSTDPDTMYPSSISSSSPHPSSPSSFPHTPPAKKPKIPHRHGEFESRRDDILHRLQNITIQELEQKAERMPENFALVIERVAMPRMEGGTTVDTLTKDQAAALLAPSLDILTHHSNMKPHQDNGMNQNGIYYNSDYFRLYLAFDQFQKTFAFLFPQDVVVVAITEEDDDDDLWKSTLKDGNSSGRERDRDRERNTNMKAYRPWIEPRLMGTHWAAFRRNIVVGERMMQLTKLVGQGVLLMTKELSGSKLHLTFTNNEWDEFVRYLVDNTTTLVHPLRRKFIDAYWFHHPQGTIVAPAQRHALYRAALPPSPSSSPPTHGTNSTFLPKHGPIVLD
ncbi:hypothetical protein BCR42DRAFT_33367 [Absidia repens]|uniref:Uncharacterized protein n=1 Tax=Absidia repens TaxID=90262 RepID=A0A1X2IGX7_9FUNG|nr:hypothetical protein BCR42DRAFT_33367 [Absidia repens]